MNHFVISAGATLASTLTASVFFLTSKSRQMRIYGCYLLSIAFWCFFVTFQFTLIESLTPFFWGFWLHLGVIFIPTLFAHHAAIYYGQSSKTNAFVKSAYVASGIFTLLCLFTNLFTSGTAYRDMYAYPKPAILYAVFFLWFVATIIISTVLMIKKVIQSPVHTTGKMRLFLVFHVLAYLGGMDNFLIMIDVRIFPMYPYGLYLVTPYALIGSYLLYASHHESLRHEGRPEPARQTES